MENLKLFIFNSKKNSGVTLFIAIVVMGTLLLVAAGVTALAVRQNLISSASNESQIAIYAANAGIECALYWDSRSRVFMPGPFTVQVNIAEFYGIATSSDPLDQTASQSGLTSGPGVYGSGARTTTYANELIYGFGGARYISGSYYNTGFNYGPSFTEDSQYVSGSTTHILEHKNVVSTGSYEATFWISGGFEYSFNMLTFRAAPGKTPALVQYRDAVFPNAYTGVTPQISFSNSSSNENLIVVAVVYDAEDVIIDSTTDNKGNTYTKALSNTWPNSFPFVTEIWYAKNIVGGGIPITISIHSELFDQRVIACNGETITRGSQLIPGSGGQTSDFGGATSTFYIDFNQGSGSPRSCAIVKVSKILRGATRVESFGYNTCDTNDPRRVERAVRAIY